MSQTAPFHRVVIVDASGDWVEMGGFSNLKYGYSLNRGTGAELQIPVKHSKINNLTTAPLQVWVRIYRWRDAEDETTEALVWYGLLFDVEYSFNDIAGDITLRFGDLASILNRRRVARDYTVTALTDASDILWDLIDRSQDETVTISAVVYNVGDIGITRGVHPASKDRMPEKDLRNRTILDVLISFSDYIDGVDWEITPTPRNPNIGIFNTFFSGAGQLYHKGAVLSSPLVYYVDDEYSQMENNVKSFSIQEVGSDYANEVLVLGATIEETQLFATATNDQQKRIYTLFEDSTSETNISEQTSLDDRADEELNAKTKIPYNIRLQLLPNQQPRFGDFDVGDIFTFRFRYYNFRDFETKYRLYRFTVNVDRDGVEIIDLELNNL